MITPKVITGPTTEPVSLTEAKLQCRLDGSTEDALLTIYIAAARSFYEWRTGRTIHQQTLEYVLDEWPSVDCIVLPRATPLVSITSVIYKDSSAVSTTWTNTEYIADSDSIPGRLVLGYGESWPSFTAYPVSPIRIRYLAGIETSPATEADSADKIPILMLVGGMYENRESVVVSEMASIQQIAVDYGVESFIRQRTVEHIY